MGERSDRPAPERSPARLAGCCPSAPGAHGERQAAHRRIARHFDRKVTRRDADPPELAEPAPISARLLDLLTDLADLDPSVLDLGCGDGAGAVRLLQAGAGRVTGIDLSPASIEIARRRAASAGLGPELARFEVGDAASERLRQHDWVLLDRVICCYGDADRLLTNALARAAFRIAFSVPESRGWRGVINAVGWRVENLWKRMADPDACWGHVHDVKRIERLLEAAGFRELRTARRGLWYAAVFERETQSVDGATPRPPQED